MTHDDLRLPSLIKFQDYRGDFSAFLEAVYDVFKNDFVYNKPIFQGKELGLKKHPLIDGREYTFYHFTHSGKDENDRKPDIERCERIPYPKPMINNSHCNNLKVWKNKRKNKTRILIYHEKEKYLVVLEDRGSYILPWTAYIVEYNNKHRRLLQEYNAYISQNRPA